VSAKNCSLAIEEVREQSLSANDQIDFEPELKVLVSRRFRKNSDSVTENESVKIGGRITISF
jgi:hypothetical protein